MKDRTKIINLEIYEKSKEIVMLKRQIKELQFEKKTIEGYKKLERDKQKVKKK